MIKNKVFSVSLLCFTLFFLFLVGFLIAVYACFYEPMQFKNKEPIILVIDKSSSAKSFVSELKALRLINRDRFFLIYIRILGLSKSLKAGTYEIGLNESANHLLHRIASGDVLKKTFQIIEGTTQTQVSSKLKIAPYLDYQMTDWELSLPNSEDLYIFCDKDPLNIDMSQRSETCVNTLNDRRSLAYLEGLFLADTYQYNAGSDGKSLLSKAHLELKNYLIKSWLHRDLSLPYKNPYELLIVASILEKESAILAERRLISGVIVNRLKQKMPLQMDPTVIYGLGKNYLGKLSHDDLKFDSKYNTYLYRGLPPTPITMVGRASIDAASHPENTNYLYFVAKGDGTHVFSKSYLEQKQAIKQYLGN